MMFREFEFSNIEQFGEVILAAVALLIPAVALILFLTH